MGDRFSPRDRPSDEAKKEEVKFMIDLLCNRYVLPVPSHKKPLLIVAEDHTGVDGFFLKGANANLHPDALTMKFCKQLLII